MLIRLLGTLAQTRVWVGRFHTLVRVPCGVNMFALLQNTVIVWMFSIFKILFLETQPLISLA